MDHLTYLMELPSDVQEWCTLAYLKDPTQINSDSNLIRLLEVVYDDIYKNKDLQHPLYLSIYQHLPSYQSNLLKALIGVDEDTTGLPDAKLLILMLSASVPWLTPVMISTPSRMSHEQMLTILKALSIMIPGHPKSGPEFDKVIAHLPTWTQKVCVEMLKPNLF
jgi:hypothetical protein